jgi:uncharacterized membrane protein
MQKTSRLHLWVILFGVGAGVYVWLPFLAPVFMHWGWTGPAKAIYFVYSWLCHQLPERSFFLFGPTLTVSLAQVHEAWQTTANPLILRQFTGSPELGWKVAWSDRMVWMYTSAWLFGLLWYPLRRRLGRLPWWGLALLLLPMALDGASHFVSDLAGIGQGFRQDNAWLAAFTQVALPESFYAGDAWGSFNSLMRLLSGLFFGLGIVWFAFPYLEESL